MLIRKKKKIIGTIYIIIIILIISIIISISYSLFSSDLKMIGKVNINNQNVDEPTLPKSSSQVRWNATNEWPFQNGVGCQLIFNIKNLDGDISGWTISFDVPKGLDETSFQVWNAELQNIEVKGNYTRITIKSYAWCANVENGENFSPSIGCILCNGQVSNIEIKNVIINGKLVRDIERDRSITQ